MLSVYPGYFHQQGRRFLLQFISQPNLPSGTVRLCAVSEEAVQVRQALQSLGVSIIPVAANPALDAPVHSHADMLLHHLEGWRLVAARQDAPCLAPLRALGFHIEPAGKPPVSPYPGDVSLDALRLPGLLLARLDALDPVIHAWCQANGIRLLDTRQGYAKCSVCIVAENAVVTADAKLHALCARQGLDALLIRPGHIALPSYAYGFIGGCTGLLAPDLLCFAGDPRRHPDYANLRSFARDHGVYLHALLPGALWDVGGILPLLEQAPSQFV